MASRGQSLTLTYVAWDTVNNVGKTGDVANHTLKWVKDGTSASLDGAPSASEVDATNAPGLYKVTVDATDCTCNFGVLCGKSSTTGISIIPVPVSFEMLPTAAPGASGGLEILGANTGTVSVSGPVTYTGGIVANITGNLSGTVGTVTTLTNLPAITANWLTGTGVDATAVTKIQAGLSTYAGGDTAGTTTLLARIPYAITFDGTHVYPLVNVNSLPAVTLDANQHVIVDSGTVTSVTNDVGITQTGADKVWGTAARTLTGFGTLIADNWSAVTRTLTSGAAPSVSDIDTQLSGTHGAGAWGAAVAGSGDTAVNHDSGGTDNLQLTESDGTTGVDNVTIRAYLKADYDASSFTIRGQTTTTSTGRWSEALMLDKGVSVPAVYTLTFSKDNNTIPSKTVTIATDGTVTVS